MDSNFMIHNNNNICRILIIITNITMDTINTSINKTPFLPLLLTNPD